MISLLLIMATCVSLFECFDYLRAPVPWMQATTFKPQQRASVRYMYKGKDVFLLVLASHYAMKFYPSWLM